MKQDTKKFQTSLKINSTKTLPNYSHIHGHQTDMCVFSTTIFSIKDSLYDFNPSALVFLAYTTFSHVMLYIM